MTSQKKKKKKKKKKKEKKKEKMEFEAPGTVRSTPSRHEKSLGLLTMKFVGLLQEAKDGVLDLKVVSDRGGDTAGSGPLFSGGIHCVDPEAPPAANKGSNTTSQVL